MNPQTECTAQQPAPVAASKRFLCRHIHHDGRRCGSPCLRHQPFCYHHHTTRKPIQNPRAHLAETNRRAAFDLPLPEDRSAIQLSIGEILHRIAANQLDPKRAGLLLCGLQIAALNLPPHPRPAAEEPAKTQPTVEEVVEDQTYGPLAPEAEFSAPQGRKSLEQILMEQWEREKEDWTREMSAPSPHPTWTDEETIPKIQAVAEGCPMIPRDAVEGLSWNHSQPQTPAPPQTTQKTFPSVLIPL